MNTENRTTYSPEAEARMRPFEAARAAQVKRITALWTRLRRKQNLPFTVEALNKKINRDWQLTYGLDSLDGEYLTRLENTLTARLEKAQGLQKAQGEKIYDNAGIS